jgi:hypothetical protein
MTDGERIEQMIAEWGKRNYPHGPTWYDRTENEPLPALEIRMMPAFGAVEYNISNGGWAQFLWNCILDWRPIIADAKEGYLLIGAPEQAAALDILYALCERDEAECHKMHERANAAYEKEGSDAWSAVFGEFTSRSGSASKGNDWEDLFWDHALYEKCRDWLVANEARVRRAYGMLD